LMASSRADARAVYLTIAPRDNLHEEGREGGHGSEQRGAAAVGGRGTFAGEAAEEDGGGVGAEAPRGAGRGRGDTRPPGSSPTAIPPEIWVVGWSTLKNDFYPEIRNLQLFV